MGYPAPNAGGASNLGGRPASVAVPLTSVTCRVKLPRLLIPGLPFFHGWVVLGCVCCAGFSRAGARMLLVAAVGDRRARQSLEAQPPARYV
jgi:hypothetical protein